MSEQYESNSNAMKAKPQITEEKKDPVVIGNVKPKKKSAGRQIVENFVNEDAETIKSHVIFDIVIPYVKDMISAGFHAALDMLLYGDGGSTRVTSSGRRIISSSSGGRDYNAISKQKKVGSAPRQQPYDDLVFEDRGDADKVLTVLEDLIDRYGFCSVYDFFETSGCTCDYTWKSWGWYDLNTAGIQRTRDGDFVINFPKPVVLNK